jgi:hypothetical protein
LPPTVSSADTSVSTVPGSLDSSVTVVPSGSATSKNCVSADSS